MMGSIAKEIAAEEQTEHTYAILYLGNQWSDSARILCNVWDRFEEDGIVKSLFFDGHINGATSFCNFMLSDSCIPHLLLRVEDNAPVAFFWMDHFEGKTAQIHCTGFRGSIGRRRNAPHFGTKCVSFCLTRRNTDGYLIDTLIGVTPVTNRLSVRFNERVGMTRIGTIPNRCFMYYEGRQSVDAVLTYATRKSLGIAEGAEEASQWQE